MKTEKAPNFCRIRLLKAEDEPALQELCRSCRDYCIMVTGREPRVSDAKRILIDLPPGKTKEDKFVYGIFDMDGQMIGVMDIVRDYHDTGEWTIGLLMIHPEQRGKGFGRRMHAFVRHLIINKGGQILRIGVFKENKRAWKFWRELGYVEQEFVTRHYEGRDHSVVIMKMPAAQKCLDNPKTRSLLD